MYRYILFDLDGTLTDSKEGILKSLRFTFEKLGRPMPSEETLIQFIGPPLQASFMEFTGMTAEEALEAIEVFSSRYVPIGKFENKPAPGLAQICMELKNAGRVLALASSKPEPLCVSICDRFGFSPALTCIAGSQPGGDSTKANVIRDCLARLNVPQEAYHQILMVGDRKFDVLGAKEVGLDCVGVEFFGYALPGELAEAGAVAVVQTPEELKDFILAH